MFILLSSLILTGVLLFLYIQRGIVSHEANAFVALLLFWRIGKLLFTPLNHQRKASDFQAGATKRKPGNIPPYYPNAWWVIMLGHELKKGDVVPVEFMGHSIIAFRGQDGKAAVLDAYCPHLGANLGIISKVVGNAVECPFHGWKFDSEGKCVHIPGQNSIPEMASIRKWPVVEKNDKIYVWHHVDKTEPTWEIPDFVNYKDWTFHGKSVHEVEAHVQEIPENGADVSHLNFLHMSWIGTKVKGLIHHIWEATWKPGTEENKDKHLAHINITQSMASYGRIIEFTRTNVQVLQCGPGFVHLDFPLPFGLHVRIIEEVTPLAPMLQRIRHSVYGGKWTPRFFAKLFLRIYVRILEQDIAVWNNKTYLPKPIYSKPDRTIPVFRKWYSQFYSERSPQAPGLLKPLDW